MKYRNSAKVKTIVVVQASISDQTNGNTWLGFTHDLSISVGLARCFCGHGLALSLVCTLQQQGLSADIFVFIKVWYIITCSVPS